VRTWLALMVVSVVLVGSLAANAYLITQQQQGLTETEDLEKQAAELQSQLATLSNQISSLQSEKADLETSIANLQNHAADLRNQSATLETENAELRSENAAIQSQIDKVTQNGTPKIITRLGARDVRESPAPGHP